MARCSTRRFRWWCSVPRACGDGSAGKSCSQARSRCSPRLRGWLVSASGSSRRQGVFPAPAGMARAVRYARYQRVCVPRACGDGSQPRDRTSAASQCSPRLRGWLPTRRPNRPPHRVFPAPAGMARCATPPRPWGCCVPRACGDGSHMQALSRCYGGMWGKRCKRAKKLPKCMAPASFMVSAHVRRQGQCGAPTPPTRPSCRLPASRIGYPTLAFGRSGFTVVSGTMPSVPNDWRTVSATSLGER